MILLTRPPGNRVSFFIRSQRFCPRDRLLSSRLEEAFRNAGDPLTHTAVTAMIYTRNRHVFLE